MSYEFKFIDGITPSRIVTFKIPSFRYKKGEEKNAFEGRVACNNRMVYIIDFSSLYILLSNLFLYFKVLMLFYQVYEIFAPSDLCLAFLFTDSYEDK